MSETRIDQIVVEINTKSDGVSKGIDSMVSSLEKLKGVGSFGKTVKSLESLKTTLNGLSVSGNTVSSLNTLATSLAKLKSVGSFATLGNNLKKLSDGAASLRGVDFSNFATQVEKIANAISPLSSIKTSGFGGMVNGLAKLKNVTESLDDNTIDAFTEKVKVLSERLTPLSDKMKTVADGFRAVNSQSKKASTGINNINVSMLNLSHTINVIRGAISVVRGISNFISGIMASSIEWEGISQRFIRGFGEQAQETYNWIKRLNEEMGINIQEFMQYSSIYANMLSGFGVNREDARKMAVGYTELTYDIWAGYNDIYKTYEEAAAAVRSAIAGEVEPIRRAGFTIIESTLQQTAANHGLEVSLENATEAQKSYLRYQTLVDQAHSQSLVGTYAAELNTAEGVMRTLSQQVKSLAQAFGSIFLPILTAVIPYVQAFVELLTDAIVAIGSFFGIQIQPVDFGDYKDGLDIGAGGNDAFADSANNAADAVKELKNATLGIDELNIISPPDANKGSGGAGGLGELGNSGAGLDIDSLWDESIFKQIGDKVDELKDKLKEWLPIVGGIGLLLAGWDLWKFADSITDSDTRLIKLKDTIAKVGKALAIAGITIAVGKLVWDFTGTYLETGSIKSLLASMGTTVIGAALAAYIAGPVGAGIVLAVSGIVQLTRLGVEISEGNIEITDPKALVTMVSGAITSVLGGALLIDAIRGGVWVKAIGTAINDGLETAMATALIKFDAVKVFAAQFIAKISTALTGMIAPIKTVLEKVMTTSITKIDAIKTFLTPFVGKITTALSGLGTMLAGLSGWAIAAIAAIVGVLVLGFINYDFTPVGETLGRLLGAVIGKPAIWIMDVGTELIKGFNSSIEWLRENFNMENIKKFLAKVFDPKFWTDTVWPWMVEAGGNLMAGLLEGINSWAGNLVENIKEFFRGLVKGFCEEAGIHSPSTVFAEIGGFLIEGLWQGIDDMFDTFIGNVETWVNNTIDNVKSFFGIKKNSPAEETRTIGKSVSDGLWAGISDKVKTLKSNLETWVSDRITDVKLKFGIQKNGSTATSFKTIGKNLVQGLIDGIGSMGTALWNFLTGWVNGIIAKVKSLFSFGDAVEAATSATNTSTTQTSRKKVNLAASGGMFGQGSLIWAGERGAEIVANAHNGRTGVMNMEQMQQAVYDGMYAAMMAAGGNQQSSSYNLYIDSREVTTSVERRQKERGVSIMGTQVYNY